MSIALLTDVYTETRRLAIAGSVVAPGDFRLQKLVVPLKKSGEKAPVFIKVAEAIERVVASTETTSATAVLELSSLVSAILYTQGSTGVDGPSSPIQSSVIACKRTQINARTLKPLLDALTTTGSGRYEQIQVAVELNLFNDLRLVRPALQAIDDSYAAIGDLIADKVLPAYGKAILSELKSTFDFKGKSGHTRRLRLIHQTDPLQSRELVKQALEEGSKEVKLAAIECLGDSAEDTSFLFEQVRARAQDMRAAAILALSKLSTPETEALLLKTLDGKDIGLLVRPAREQQPSALIAAALSRVRDQLPRLAKQKDKSKQKDDVIRFSYLLQVAAAKLSTESEPVLHGGYAAMSDDELASLPRRSSKLTLMPYSYFRLSAQSGYGAGNAAPAYFELMWESLQANDLAGLGARYLSLVARQIRDNGTHRSTAEVIEGVRLANTLSALKDGLAATLGDLHDAAVTLLGHGELSSIAAALASVDVGTAIGELPKGVSRTSIQEDFDREVMKLKLEKYRTTVKQDLSLDLRENRQAKKTAAAYLDLARSTFLHRLRMLNVKFADPVASRQESATWAENWQIQWTPESEITLVESVLMGETIEVATAYQFRQLIDKAKSIDEAAKLVRDACQCGLAEAMEFARQQLQDLASENSAIIAVASAVFELMQVVKYGDVRKFDTAPLLPLIDELFVQGCLGLHEAASCDASAAKSMLVAIDQINRISLEFHERVDEAMWRRKLQALSDADDRNPVLSGLACAVLLERGWMGNDQLAREVSRRLSPGIAAELGAGWFEGLAKRNRYALIARQVLWQELTQFVSSLDEDQFRRSLVFLRRAFGEFGPQEKRSIAENLATIWGVHADDAGELLDGPLSDKEQQAIADLNEFEF